MSVVTWCVLLRAAYDAVAIAAICYTLNLKALSVCVLNFNRGALRHLGAQGISIPGIKD